jgi:repressor of nif and glnA expression
MVPVQVHMERLNGGPPGSSESGLTFVNNRIEDLAMEVSYNPGENTGKIIFNLSLIQKENLEAGIGLFKAAYRAGLSVSDRIRILSEKEEVNDLAIPEGLAGICTLCTITLDGILLRKGVPIRPIGGGLVEIDDRVPRRFTHMILYEATTIDPLEVLVAQDLTSITRVMREGSGTILANLRECHMEAESLVMGLLDDLSEAGFTGILEVGAPNVPILGVPVDPQYFGLAMVGGTNPMAVLKEEGIPVVTKALKGVMDVAEMGSIRDY